MPVRAWADQARIASHADGCTQLLRRSGLVLVSEFARSIDDHNHVERPLLASGWMGEVYRARDMKLNRDVAIKGYPFCPEWTEEVWSRRLDLNQ